jgi:DNA-binding NarL/FixJ family response regulator
MTSVLITDREALFAEGVECLLVRAGYSVRIVGRSLGTSAVVTTAERFEPDVILVGVGTRDEADALELIRSLAELRSVVIAVASSDDPVVWAGCIERGASAVIGKAQHADDLLSAIDEIARGGAPMSVHTREELLAILRRTRAAEQEQQAPFRHLTGREAQVLAGLIDGRTASQLSKDLGVRLTTIRSHIRAALQKLGVKSQLAAVAMARRAGWPADRYDSRGNLRVLPSDRRISLDRPLAAAWAERAGSNGFDPDRERLA